MSILIRGMEMPKSCWGCPFSAHYDPDTDRCLVTEKLFETNWARFNDRLPDCPLVPVPPHGRLIEKNAVFELIRSFPNVDRQLPVEFMKALYELLTIIEAEESE